MKVLIVAKTRQGNRACVGGIAADGSSVRLLPLDPERSSWGLDFEVGQVWEIDGDPAPFSTAPHVEDFLVRTCSLGRTLNSAVPTIERFMPPVAGGPTQLFEGLAQRSGDGSLFVSEHGGVPSRSTHFWRTDRPLHRELGEDRVQYSCEAEGGGVRLPFVGFQEPVEEIPAGSLVRVSLEPWSRPADGDEPRCLVQLSGWFDTPTEARSAAPVLRPTPARATQGPVDLEAARKAMHEVFGYDSFRPLQEEIIACLLAGQDCVGIMPTGAGKSLCYQVPALLLPGLTVVVSPLLSLMQDQIDQLRQAGVRAVTLNSMVDRATYADGVRQVRSGEAKLLYVAPETLLRPETQALLSECRVSCLTVDEAHCISEWGHDFRPEYRRLREVRNAVSGAACLALTATATGRVQNDIRTILGIPEETTFVAGFDRPNLYLDVRPREDAVSQVLAVVREHGDQSGIVYCSTREQVDRMVSELQRNGVKALAYHAGMGDAARRENQRLFQRDEANIIVATVAFGMGINKSNVRYIIHHSLPDCLETYYQQIGRAGRDGLRSECILLFSRGDVGTIYHFIDTGAPKERAGRTVRLQAMLRYAGASVCRRRPLLGYFDDEPTAETCGMCDNCLAEADGRERVDATEDARLFLKAVQQTRERFGTKHVIGVLRGSAAERIRKWNHDRLEVHGAGRQHSEDEWQLLVDRFLELGIVEQEPEHGTLRVGAAGRAVLDGESVTIIQGERKSRSGAAQPEVSDPLLFEALRKLRKELADAQGVPPYVVFSDRSLTEMSAFYPETSQEFLKVHGVGERRAEVYGEPFLELIRRHVAEHGKKDPPPQAPPKPTSDAPRGNRFLEVGEAFCRGESIADLQERWGVTQSTITGHLYNFIRSGRSLDGERVLAESTLSEEDRRAVLEAFERLGPERLSPVFQDLGERIPYEALHLLRVCFLAGSRAGT